jgi:molybdopterin converting factor small subunit
MASIKIPTPLRQYTSNHNEVPVEGRTVGEALESLTVQYPDLRPHLYDGADLRNFVNVFLGDEDIRFLQELDTPIEAQSRLRIIPAIAGG